MVTEKNDLHCQLFHYGRSSIFFRSFDDLVPIIHSARMDRQVHSTIARGQIWQLIWVSGHEPVIHDCGAIWPFVSLITNEVMLPQAGGKQSG